MSNGKIKIIEDLMKKAQSVSVTSICEDGYPRTVTMSNIKPENINILWLSTGLDSVKVKHFQRDSRCSVCYNVDHHNITLIGDIEVFEDEEVKKNLWLDWFIDHFPQGITDPNYCILKFTTKRVSVWIDDIFEEFEIKL